MEAAMKRTLLILAVEVATAGCLFGQMTGMHHDTATAPVDNTPRTHRTDLTFTKDVAPIMQQHCESCHRPGEGTPFSMLTYESTKPWAKDIKKMVDTLSMSLCIDTATTEKFENKRSLTQDQINTIVDWVNSGAAKG